MSISKESKWIALYYYCRDYYPGMGSWQYQYLSNSHYKPGVLASFEKEVEESPEIVEYYLKLVEKFEDETALLLECLALVDGYRDSVVDDLVLTCQTAKRWFDIEGAGNVDVDIRLRIHEGCYSVAIGDAQYDDDHHGICAATTFTTGDTEEELKSILEDLIQQIVGEF